MDSGLGECNAVLLQRTIVILTQKHSVTSQKALSRNLLHEVCSPVMYTVLLNCFRVATIGHYHC